MIDKREDVKVLVNVNHTNDEEAIFLAPTSGTYYYIYIIIVMYMILSGKKERKKDT